MKMFSVKIITSLSLIAFGAINCKPNSDSVNDPSGLNALESNDSAASSSEGASFALADQAAEPCPNPNAAPDGKVEVY